VSRSLFTIASTNRVATKRKRFVDLSQRVVER
jgi:hypothetical protein